MNIYNMILSQGALGEQDKQTVKIHHIFKNDNTHTSITYVGYLILHKYNGTSHSILRTQVLECTVK